MNTRSVSARLRLRVQRFPSRASHIHRFRIHSDQNVGSRVVVYHLAASGHFHDIHNDNFMWTRSSLESLTACHAVAIASNRALTDPVMSKDCCYLNFKH